MSGQSISSLTSDLGIGNSTLKHWGQMIAEQVSAYGPHQDMSLERARLRQENELLHQQRDLLKKRRPSSLKRLDDEVRFDRCVEGRHVSSTPVLLRSCQH